MRVYGLDISKDAIACVEIETAFGKFEIRETHELPLPQGLDALSIDPIASAAGLLNQLPGKPDRLVTALPAEIATFRNLQLATKDKKAIRAALEFELEDDLPFERENLHYDSAILDAGSQGSLIHIGAVKKDNFLKHLEHLTTMGVDPDIITTDAWAFRSLFSRIQKTPNKGEWTESSLLIGFEKHKTYFYVNSKNRPVLYREIPFGLKTIERKLQEQMGATTEELKSYIQDIGVSGIDEQVSNAIADILETLVPELKQTELAARSQLQGSFDQVYVTGEGSLLPGFMDWLSDALQKPCQLFRPLSLLSGASVTYSDLSEIRFAKALALAMSLIPQDKAPVLNLRKGDFSKASLNGSSPLELIKKPLPYILVMSLVFFATKTIEYNYFRSKLSETEENVKRAVKSYYGGISDSAARTYLADPEKLKKTIMNDVAKERELAKLLSPNPNSPLEFLKNLSQKLGKDVVLDLATFDLGADYTDRFTENKAIKASLTFIVSNPQIISKLSDIIEKNFALKKGNSEEFTQEGKKVYRIIFSGTLGAVK